MSKHIKRVAVVGASPKEGRYSNQAVALLKEHGHDVIPINPAAGTILGLPVVAHLADLTGPVDTVTMYVTEKISNDLKDDLLALKPGRVIFNPGTENSALREALERGGIETLEACTLVLLRTGQF